MIVYDNRDLVRLLFRKTGSLIVSPSVIFQTMFSCIVSVVVFHYPTQLNLPEHLEWPAWVYSTVLAFAIIFRISLAYSRYWEGISSSVAMLSQWRGAYVNLNAFLDASILEHKRMGNFQHIEELLESRARLLHWFSLLHAVAIQTLQWREDPDPLRPMTQSEIDDMQKPAFWDPLRDRESCARIFILSQTSRPEREQIEAAFDKLTHVVHWIEYEVSLLHLFKRLLISSPILTRVFEDLSGGTLAYCQAHTIAFIPFPFLFAQVLSYALYVFIFVCPFIIQASLKESLLGLTAEPGSWPALVTMNILLVAGFSCLNEIAIELEDPFREKSNNFPVRVIQRRIDWSCQSVTLQSSTPHDWAADSFGEDSELYQYWCEDMASTYALEELPRSTNVPVAAQSTVVACEDLQRSVLSCIRALEKDGMDLWQDMRRTELELCGLAFRAFASDGRGVASQALFYDAEDHAIPGLIDLGLDRPPESCDVPEEHCPGRPREQAVLNPQHGRKVMDLQTVDPRQQPSASSTETPPERSRNELDLQSILRRSAVVNSRMAPLLMRVMAERS